MAYQKFSEIYDELMSDVPYDLWFDLFKDIQNKYLVRSNHLRVLDLGCGTGTLTVMLAEEGYDLTGIDLSSDMLSIAQNKANDAGLSIPFFQQDMKELNGFQPFDCINVFCDSLNYLKNEDEVIMTFRKIYEHLKPGGIFLFDVHSTFKMDHVFIDNTFASNDEKISFIWNCFKGNFDHSVEHDLSFFIKEEDIYRRYDELHFQRTYPIEQYKMWLAAVKFNVLEIFADFHEQEILENSERIFFVCQKGDN